jgi:biopolymer transport protein ExbD
MAAANDPATNRLRGKKAIRAFSRKLGEVETIKDLNIVPMMDMMTIILVFLLKSFSSSTDLLTLPADMQLPRSQTRAEPKQALQVTVSQSVILIEGDAVATVKDGRVDSAVKRDGENGYHITPIVDTLNKHARRERKVDELQERKFEGELMVVADKSTPYRLLTEVLYSAGQAGYAKYRLLVLKNAE